MENGISVSKRAKGDDVVVVAMRVSPATARRWLKERSPDGYNRNVRESHVRSLAEEMIGDRFKCTPQPVIFTAEGKLADGQHRLHAIAAANVGIWLRVSYHIGSSVEAEIRPGVPPADVCCDDVSGPIDCGMPRPAYVIRGLQGNREFGRERRIQAIVHALDVYRGDDRLKVTPGHIDAVVVQYKGGIQWAADALQHNIPVVGAAALAIAWQRKSTRQKVEEFASVVADRAFHNDPTRSAFMAYEEMRSGASRKPGPRRDHIARIVRCIAAFCEGRSIRRINTRSVSEAYFTKAS